MMINEFLVDDDQGVPCQWWSVTSLSLMTSELLVDDDEGVLVNDDQRFLCRWWSMSSLSMMINDFLVDDDQWLPCRWWPTSSLSMMINELSIDDKRFPCRWWSTISSSRMTPRVLPVNYHATLRLFVIYSRNNPADGNSSVVISDCPNMSLCLCTNWQLISFRTALKCDDASTHISASRWGVRFCIIKI